MGEHGHEGHGHEGHGHEGHGHEGHGHEGHVHVELTPETDRRWLLGSLVVIVAFMVGEVIVGVIAHSLALIADSAHLLTDAAALALAIGASLLAQRPARGAYTYGFTRADALAGQANGITLLLLAAWVTLESVKRLIDPPEVHGGLVVAVAAVGVVVNMIAVALAGRANKASLNVRGAMAHIVSDLYAFIATLVAGLIILSTDWTRADPIASLVVAALMVWTGIGLVRAAGRVFLEAAPHGLLPDDIGQRMAAVAGVSEVHDLHVWDLGAAETALSAHLVVGDGFDCHEVSSRVRSALATSYRITHATLQADHSHDAAPLPLDECQDAHGPGYSGTA